VWLNLALTAKHCEDIQRVCMMEEFTLIKLCLFLLKAVMSHVEVIPPEYLPIFPSSSRSILFT
jgi:hypothetical protein